MNFFRLRIINTALVLLIGFLFGYILRDPAPKKAAGPYVPVYPRVSSEPGPAAVYSLPPAPAAREKSFAPGAAAPAKKTGDTGDDSAPPARPAREPEYEVTYGAGPGAGDRKQPEAASAKTAAADILKGAEDAFFRNPARYAGRYLGMELQMVLSRKTPNGWVLNLVYARGGKNADYIYIEDDFLLGEKPDLRIGYFYHISFLCGGGSPNSGNKLLGINASGKKAPWATGVTAVE